MIEKIRRLEESLLVHAPLLVAYSGGVDSTCLLAVAHRTLGDSVLGVIADSPSLGFRVFRVRYLAPSGARVQIAPGGNAFFGGVTR